MKLPRRIEKRIETNCMKTKTISDYALLIGELIHRAELRKTRRQHWSTLFQDQSVSAKAVANL
jgi:hypothetical protein